MIKLQEMTPNVYYNQSRDFQYIGRLFDIVLNSVKTNAELIYEVPFGYNFNEKLIDLLALTLGFKAKHNYNTKQLIAICSVFSEIIRHKGSIKAFELACNAILNAEGIDEPISYAFKDKTPINLIVYLPPELSDVTLLKDLMEYVLPAGMNCDFVKMLTLKKIQTTEFELSSSINYVSTDSNAKLAEPGTTNVYDNLNAICPNGVVIPGIFTTSTLWQATDNAMKEK